MWYAIDLDDTLLHRDGTPEDGAIEAMAQLLQEGHRVTIWTARFSKVSESEKPLLQLKIEGELEKAGIPFTDVWAGPKPPADVFIGDNLVPFTGNWPKTLAEAHMMLETRGGSNQAPPHEYGEIE